MPQSSKAMALACCCSAVRCTNGSHGGARSTAGGGDLRPGQPVRWKGCLQAPTVIQRPRPNHAQSRPVLPTGALTHLPTWVQQTLRQYSFGPNSGCSVSQGGGGEEFSRTEQKRSSQNLVQNKPAPEKHLWYTWNVANPTKTQKKNGVLFGVFFLSDFGLHQKQKKDGSMPGPLLDCRWKIIV